MSEVKETTKAGVLKAYFSVPGKPVTMAELREFIKGDSKGYNELAELCAKELGVTIKKVD